MLPAGCNLTHLYGRSLQQAALRTIAIIAGQPPSIPSHMWLSCSLHPFLLSRMLPAALSLCTCGSCFPHPSLSSIPAASPGRAPARGWAAALPGESTGEVARRHLLGQAPARDEERGGGMEDPRGIADPPPLPLHRATLLVLVAVLIDALSSTARADLVISSEGQYSPRSPDLGAQLPSLSASAPSDLTPPGFCFSPCRLI